MSRASILLLVAALAAGCTRDAGPYPSLAPRTIEGGSFEEPAAPPAAGPVADPALDRAVAGAEAELAQIARRFDEAGSDAERRVAAAAGRPAGSDAWLDAQIALATLDAVQADASALLTSLEERAILRATDLAAPAPALDAAIAAVRARAGDQAARIRALAGRLAPA